MKHAIIRGILGSMTLLGLCAGYVPTASAALSGKCGIIAAFPHTFETMSTNDSKTMDVLAIVDFDASTITYNETDDNTDGSGNLTTSSTAGGSVSFSVTADTPFTGAYQLSFNPGGGTVYLNVLPVNSNNTFLIQGQNDQMYGVCQKL